MKYSLSESPKDALRFRTHREACLAYESWIAQSTDTASRYKEMTVKVGLNLADAAWWSVKIEAPNTETCWWIA